MSHSRSENRVRKNQDKMEMRMRKLQRYGEQWEFGKCLDFHNPVVVSDYLHYYNDWLKGIVFPVQLDRARHFANKVVSSKPYKKIALEALYSAGSKRAKILLDLHAGLYSVGEYDARLHEIGQLSFKPQSMEVVVLTVAIALFLVAFGLGAYAGPKITTAVKGWHSLVAAADAVVQVRDAPVMGCEWIVEKAKHLMASVRDAAVAAWQHFMSFIDTIMSSVENVVENHKFLIRSVVCVLFFSVAVEYVRTYTPELFAQVMEFLCSCMEIPLHWVSRFRPQSGGSSCLSDIMDFGRRMLTNLTEVRFIAYFEKLPKFVSVAKAIEWIGENIYYIYGRFVEMWTGELSPRTKLEEDIFSFVQLVEDVTKRIADHDVAIVFSDETQVLMDGALLEKKRIENVVRSDKKLRQVFVNMFATKSSNLEARNRELCTRKKSAEKRPTPVWLFIHGAPGVGKTKSVEAIMELIWVRMREAQLVEGDFSYQNTYNWNQAEEFFDGYGGQFFFLIDDLFQIRDPQSRMVVASQLINMVAPTPYALRVATVEDKAHSYFKSRCIITTSNNEHFKNLVLESPEALKTRRSIVAHMVQEDGEPCFEVVTGEETIRLTLVQLATLTAACIVKRERQVHEPLNLPEPSPMRIKFVGGRIELEEKDFDFQPQAGRDPYHILGVAKGEDYASAYRRHCRKVHPDKGAHNEIEWGNITWSRDVLDLEKRVPGIWDALGDGPGMDVMLQPLTLQELPGRAIYERMGLWLTKRLAFSMPHLFLRDPGFLPNRDEASVFWREKYLDAHATSEFWRMWLEATRSSYQELLSDPDAMMAQLSSIRVQSKKFILAIGVAPKLVGFAIGWYIVKRFLPQTAFEPQAEYTTSMKVKKPIPSRAVRRENMRVLRRAGVEVPLRSQATSPLYNQIMPNYERMEVRVGARNWSYEDAVEKNAPVTSSWVLFIAGSKILLPLHTVYENLLNEGMTAFLTFGAVRSSEHTVRLENVVSVTQLGGDLGVIDLGPQVSARKDIRNLFEDELPTTGKFARIKPSVIGTFCEYRTAASYDLKKQSVYVGRGYEDFECDIRFHGMPNAGGDCGIVYIHEGTGKIVAMHTAGCEGTDVAAGTMVFKSDLAEFKAQGLAEPLKCFMEPTNYMTGVNILGRLRPEDGVYMPRETAIRPSMLNWKTFPVAETTDEPGPLSERGGLSPLRNALAKFASQKAILPHPQLESFAGFLPVSFNPGALRVLSLEEAVYGIPGYIDSVDFTTSSGYKWKKLGMTRKFLCFEGSKPRIHPLLKADVDYYMQVFDTQVMPVVYEETLKDELRPLEKVESANVRLFSAGDFTSFVVQRMFLGTFVAELLKDPVGSPVGLAINPHGKQWAALYARLRGTESRYVGAGDFTSYDISLKNALVLDFIRLVEPLMGFDPRIARVIWANFFGWHICQRTVFARPWGTSSGSYLTSVFNTFANWALHKHAFRSLYTEEDWRFVEATFVGDDSVFTVPERFNRFHMEYLESYFRRVFQMTYTSCQKDGSLAVSWDDLTFLKRRFVVTETGVMAPLAQRSLANMVKWTMNPGDYEVVGSVLQSVLLEAWHFGSDFYEKCFRWAVSESRRLGRAYPLLDWVGMTEMRL